MRAYSRERDGLSQDERYRAAQARGFEVLSIWLFVEVGRPRIKDGTAWLRVVRPSHFRPISFRVVEGEGLFRAGGNAINGPHVQMVVDIVDRVRVLCVESLPF